ncbi:MAG: Dyp-type peroxidase [Acidobacteriaceae bacterium]|nr:Dyp-type peroxidase [Acidobacteriaceae bacterium]
MNLRAGIDTHDPDFHLIVKLNLPFDDRDRAIAVLRAIEGSAREKLDPSRCFGIERVSDQPDDDRRLVVRDLRLNLLVGFGLRFFMGSLERRTDEEPVPNFPPGGVFRPRKPRRFGIIDRSVPMYLRTMSASGDRDFVAKRLTKTLGREGSTEEVDQAYREWLGRSESDLILLFESDNLFLVIDFWDAVRRAAVLPFGLEVVCAQQGLQRGDGRDHTGFHDGISNLQDKLRTDPQYYRTKVYLPHPAPAYPGDPDWSRDDSRYDGGTYLVHRKYIEHLDRWNADSFEVKDRYGRVFRGEEARLHAIGRDRESGRVISRANGKLLDSEPDGTEVNLSYDEGHVLKARGGVTAPFGAPFPPLSGNQTNVFNTQDIRVRRRGVNFCEIDPSTGEIVYGLHFICYQNNIQQTGFEFINNVWLLNPMFRKSTDGLFNPEAGVIEPIEGCYYFIPPEHREYPGEVFFE